MRIIRIWLLVFGLWITCG